MTIDRISVVPLRIPLQVRFSQSNQDTLFSDSLLIILQTRDHLTGYGECCPRLYVTGETIESVSRQVERLNRQVRGTNWAHFSEILDWLSDNCSNDLGPAASCGVEMAILDAWAKHKNRSVGEILHAALDAPIEYSGVIPMSQRLSLEPLLARFWFGSLKAKVSTQLQWNLDRIQWLHDLYGEQTDIRVDVNGGWTLEEAKSQIPFFLKLGINSFEQPLHPDQDHLMPSLMEEFGQDAMFIADESVTTRQSAEKLLAQDGFSGFNLKLSKHGGLLRTLEVYRLAQKNGLSCQLGAHFGETSLLTTAGILFSGLAPELLYHEGALGTWLLQKDVCIPDIRINELGKIPTPSAILSGPGWGLNIQIPGLANSSASAA